MKKLISFLFVFFVGVAGFAQVDLSDKYLPNPDPIEAKIEDYVNVNRYRKILLNRFLDYVQVDSQSVEGLDGTFVLSDEVRKTADLLYAELQGMLRNNPAHATVNMSEWKYIYVRFPSNLPERMKAIPSLGFSCHYDVTPDEAGHDIKPIVHKHYKGGILWINKDLNMFLDPNMEKGEQAAPYLKQLIGETIVTSDGTTLLGADDKAGVSVLMTTIQTLIDHPEIPHGELQIVFTPNEDVGQSAEYLSLKDEPAYLRFTPDIAFDFDGQVDGQVMVENFIAENYKIDIAGRPFHGMNAMETDGMSAIFLQGAALSAFSEKWWPWNSQQREKYLDFYDIDTKSIPGHVVLSARARGFTEQELREIENRVSEVVDSLATKYRTQMIVSKVFDYDNVGAGVSPLAWPIAWAAVTASGATPHPTGIRAGTTLAMMYAKSQEDPDTPAITGYTYFTGQQNEHTKYEWLSEKDMFLSYKTAMNTILQVIEQSVKNSPAQ